MIHEMKVLSWSEYGGKKLDNASQLQSSKGRLASHYA